MDPSRGGANAMRLAPDYEPPTRARRDGATTRGAPSDDMPRGAMGAEGGSADTPGAEAAGDASTGSMPRGEMNGDAAGMGDRLAGVMGEPGSAEMPNGGMPGDPTAATGASPTGVMPAGAMSGGMDAVTGATPGADGMPSGSMNEQQNGAKPGETTPNRATLEGAVGGLTIRGEWRFTLSSISTGSDG